MHSVRLSALICVNAVWHWDVHGVAFSKAMIMRLNCSDGVLW